MSFEKNIVATKKRFFKSAKRVMYFGIGEQYTAVSNWLDKVPPKTVAGMLDEIIKPEPINSALYSIYLAVGIKIGQMYREELQGKKVKSAWADYFDNFILPAMMDRNKIKIKSITETTSDIVRELINQLNDQGEGVQVIKQALIDSYKTTAAYRAEAIARTEVNSAANQSAFESTKGMGIKVKKYWSTSGLQNIRPSHIKAEEDSYATDGIEEDQKFSNGLMYPGDPEGSAEEVINCRCTLILLPA